MTTVAAFHSWRYRINETQASGRIPSFHADSTLHFNFFSKKKPEYLFLRLRTNLHSGEKPVRLSDRM